MTTKVINICHKATLIWKVLEQFGVYTVIWGCSFVNNISAYGVNKYLVLYLIGVVDIVLYIHSNSLFSIFLYTEDPYFQAT